MNLDTRSLLHQDQHTASGYAQPHGLFKCWSGTVCYVGCITAIYTKHDPCMNYFKVLINTCNILSQCLRHSRMIYWQTPEFWDFNHITAAACTLLHPHYILQAHLATVSWGPLVIESLFKLDFLGIVCSTSVLSSEQAQYLEWWHLQWTPSGNKWSVLCITQNYFYQRNILELQIGFASGWSRPVLWNDKQRNASGCWCSARHALDV